jgi:1,4-dihydroxy-2-naphthoate octaprenyltransferase
VLVARIFVFLALNFFFWQLTLPLVWLVALLSMATGAGSMVINDYFDHRAGVDCLKPKPLSIGTVHPEQVCMRV